jgi:hypothetical protein
MNAAGILSWTNWRELTISNFDQNSKWNLRSFEYRTCRRFVMFPTNICMSHSNKQSNNYGHWKIVRDNFFWWKSENGLSFQGRKKIWFENRTKITNWNKWRMIFDHSWSGCMWKSEWGPLELWSFLGGNDHRQRKARSDKYEGMEDLLWWMMLFGFDWRLGSLVSWVFKLGFLCRLRMMIENWTARRPRLAFLSC